METKYIITGIVVLVLLFVIFYIKEIANEKKGINSREKQRIKEIIKEITKSDDYEVIYATW